MMVQSENNGDGNQLLVQTASVRFDDQFISNILVFYFLGIL